MVTVEQLYTSRGLTLKNKGTNKRGREMAGPCPSCGGDDRFCVWPDQNNGQGSYACRGCARAGDVLQFFMDFEGMSFREAAKAAGKELAHIERRSCPQPPKRAEDTHSIEAAPVEDASPEWKTKASAFAEWCTEQLFATPEQLTWLNQRGLDFDAITTYRIGWNPGDDQRDCLIRPRKIWGLPDAPPHKGGDKPRKHLWLPRGIVVPALESSGTVKRIRIRRPECDRTEDNLPKIKYYVVPGSNMEPLLLPQKSASILPVSIACVVVESELDAIMLHHHTGELCSVLSSMTAKIRSLPPAIYQAVKNCAVILVATDVNDESEAGKKGWELWHNTFPQAVRWPCVQGKDPGEMFAAGVDMREWILAGLPEMYATIAMEKLHHQKDQAATPVTASEPIAASKLQPPPIVDSAVPATGTPPDPMTKGDCIRAQREALPLYRHYWGSPDMVKHMLEIHGLALVPTGDDFVLEGTKSFRAEDTCALFQFLRRHRVALNHIAHTLNTEASV